MADYRTLLVETEGGVALVTLNRPEARNALNSRMGYELGHAFATLEADDSVRVIVVTGAGSAFCAGADLGTATPFGPGGDDGPIDGYPPISAMAPWQLSTPIIAAINGAAVGVGITYPLQWDIRIANRDAKLGFVFTRRGLIPEGNSLWLLPRVVGTTAAMELLLTARIFTGAEAEEMGLVTKAVAADEVLPTAMALARDIADNTAPVSVAITKRLFYQYLETGDRAAARAEERELFTWTLQQPDAAEGIASFLEKRPPVWKMSKTADLPPL
ncbi:MAG TPA: enoyl-CoA hydratase-related protein [Acidimicrobiales bacterium]|nr:enoyl-CoA hydratase-related protein [Acidimicrobiales bacterium]